MATSVYISELDPDIPPGSSLVSQGDDEIRRIKNALHSTLGNLSGPVTLDHREINAAAFAAGTRLLFQQASAPTNWERVSLSEDDAMLRVVSTAPIQDGVQGSDNPVVNDRVVQHDHDLDLSDVGWHDHRVIGSTKNDTPDHTHRVELGGGSHTHDYERGDREIAMGTVSPQARDIADREGTTGGGSHEHSGDTKKPNSNHAHPVDITSRRSGLSITGTTETTGGSAWQPRYIDVILCQKSTL